MNKNELRSIIRQIIKENVSKKPTSLKIGEIYPDAQGNSVTITDIYVVLQTASGVSDTIVVYDYETIDGRSGKGESNSLKVFIKNMGFETGY